MTASAPAPEPLPRMGDVTRLLQEIRQGNPGAVHELAPLIYGELRRMARRQMRGERSDHTLQTTALVHEAYLKMTGGGAGEFNGRSHFFAVAAQVMRQILVDSARNRLAKKRGGGAARVALTDTVAVTEEGLLGALAVNEALGKLEELDERQARVVEMHFYGGLGMEEIAEVLGVSVRTVLRDWKSARAWLYAELGPGK